MILLKIILAVLGGMMILHRDPHEPARLLWGIILLIAAATI